MTVVRRSDPPAVERILRALPQWFGIEEAIEDYVRDAADLPSHLARTGDDVVGVALVRRHFPSSAELHLIAVHPAHRGAGVGRALVESVEADLVRDGVRLLQVHTVGPSHEDEHYAQTRGFYDRLGFVPLQELHGIDWDGPTLVLVKPLDLQARWVDGRDHRLPTLRRPAQPPRHSARQA